MHLHINNFFPNGNFDFKQLNILIFRHDIQS